MDSISLRIDKIEFDQTEKIDQPKTMITANLNYNDKEYLLKFSSGALAVIVTTKSIKNKTPELPKEMELHAKAILSAYVAGARLSRNVIFTNIQSECVNPECKLED